MANKFAGASNGVESAPNPLNQPVDPAGAGVAATEPEREIWVGRTNWKHFVGRVMLWLLSVTGLAVVAWVVWDRLQWLSFSSAALVWTVAAGVVSVLVLAKVFVAIVGQSYRLTSQRLFISRGILSQTVDQTELVRVDDVRVSKSLLDRVFGLGTVHVLSSDASDREVEIVGVAHPEQVAEAVRSRMKISRKSTVFIENV
jgi:membrane protein YdbS with pleckstrin-like domain